MRPRETSSKTPILPRVAEDEPPDDLLTMLGKYEKEFGSRGTYVLYQGRRTLIHNEIMQRLQLVAEQTVSTTMIFEIIGRMAMIRERDAVEAATQDSANKPARKSWVRFKREHSDFDLMVMGQAERDMDSGKRPFVRHVHNRMPVNPIIMAELKLESGQFIDMDMATRIVVRQDRRDARAPRPRKLAPR